MPPTAPSPTLTQTCALCGLPARAPITLDSPTPESAPIPFCCNGCRNVWRILEESNQLAPGQDPRDSPLYQQAAQLGLVARPDEPALSSSSRPGDGAIDSNPAEATPADEYGAIDDIRECTLRLDGMWCSSCAWLIAETLRRKRGVVSASVSFATDSARIAYKPARLGVEQLRSAIRSLGYAADEAEADGETLDEAAALTKSRKQRRRLELIRVGIAVFFAMDVMMVTPALYSGQFEGMGHFALQFISWLLLGFSVPVVIAAWPSIFHRAYQAARRGAIGMESLISIGAGVALLYSLYETARGSGRSYFDTADMLLALVMTGKYIESNIRASAADAVSLLQGLMPRKAVLITEGGREQMVASSKIAQGDTLRVRAGETIAADGEIERGAGSVDESLLTGESRPIAKCPGDPVLGGSALTDGSLDIRVTRAPNSTVAEINSDPPAGTALHQIAALVQESLHRKTRSEESADRISRIFVPLVLALAAVSGLTVYFAFPGHHNFAAAMTRAVAVLVIACPCALGIATPMALLAAVAAAARRGILISDPESLLAAVRLKSVIFDKTGTLTEGRFQVQTVQPANFNLADYAALERQAEHPIARAIQTHADLTILPAAAYSAPIVTDFQRIQGLGVTGRVGERSLFVGSPRFAEQSGAVLPPNFAESAALQAAQGQTVVVCGELHPPRAQALISLGDTLRPHVADLVASLSQSNIATEIISGDSPATVQTVARYLAIDHYQGGVLPEGKSALIDQRQQTLRAAQPNATLAFLGDGINDAPALAHADIGIAMASGASLAGRAAGITLVGSRIERLLDLVHIARATTKVVRQNLFWALGYNVICIPLAILGFITPLWAAAAMLASSLTVIANSRRLAVALDDYKPR